MSNLGKEKYNLVLCDGDLPNGINFPNGMAAIDAEMMGLNPQRDKLCLVQVSDGEGNVWIVKFSGNSYNAPNLKKLFADTNTLKLIHFAKTDMVFFKTYLGVIPAPVYCTRLASKLCRTYTEKHSLIDVCKELLDIQLNKDLQCSNWGKDVLTESQKHYAASDVLYLHSIKKELDILLENLNRTELAKNSFDAIPAIVMLKYNGWEPEEVFSY